MQSEIVDFNVGGQRFATSRQTLTWVPDSFFTSLLSGRIPSITDSTGAYFIDRDPDLFSCILNYLRTKDIDLRRYDAVGLKREAEYYSIQPLINRLALCNELTAPSCGGLMFHGYIPPPESLSTPSLHNHYSDSISKQRKFELRNQVTLIRGHCNWIAAAYAHHICIYKIKERSLWQCIWTSECMDDVVERLAINARVTGLSAQESPQRMVAASYGSNVTLWQVTNSGEATVINTFLLTVLVDELMFIGNQLIALGKSGKLGVWNSMSHHWQVQDVSPIMSFDVAGTNLLLGCQNGSIYYIDMQKFPLRMKDNDLLISVLYEDTDHHAITALSVYVSPSTSISGNRVELAYGTDQGAVNIIVQQPETVGQGPQLFQTFSVHTSPITSVRLTDKYILSACSEYNHVRTWSITRFRGMISTQPGPIPLASFKLLSLQDTDPLNSYSSGNQIGPFGDSADEQLFVQKVLPESASLYVRLAAEGENLAMVRSVDGSDVTSFCVHDCEGSSRMGSRPRRYLFTGHSNGSLQVWDLSTALEMAKKPSRIAESAGGPTPEELLKMLDVCEVSSSRLPTPSVSPSHSLILSNTARPGQRTGSLTRQRRPNDTP